MNGYRNYDLKVTGQTIKRLRLAMELYPGQLTNEGKQIADTMGVDAFAEFLIVDQIAEHFPKVLELERAQSKFKSKWIADNAQDAAR